jgi:hypothetical protein
MAGGVITTGNEPKLLWPGLFATFGRGYNETAQEWKPLVDVFSSKKAYEEIVQIVGFAPAPAKPEGTPTQYDSEWQGFITRFIHIAYGLGYIVTQEEIDDNLYPQVAAERAEALAFSFRQTKETIVANFYNNMPTVNGPDGVPFISAAHPLQGGGLGSNTLAVPADLSEASLEDLVIQMMYTTDDRGNRISLMPRSLIIQHSEMFNAQRILKSTFQSGTANNDINALKYLNMFPEGVKINRYLTAPHTFFIRTNIMAKQGPIMFQRNPIKFSDDGDYDTGNMKYKAYERYCVGMADWRGIFASVGP